MTPMNKKAWLWAAGLSVWIFQTVYIAVSVIQRERPRYVGECEQIQAGRDYYWRQYAGKHLFCAQMYPVDVFNGDKPHAGGKWWEVYIIGSNKDAVFSTREDAIAWADAQRLVVDPRQVR